MVLLEELRGAKSELPSLTYLVSLAVLTERSTRGLEESRVVQQLTFVVRSLSSTGCAELK